MEMEIKKHPMTIKKDTPLLIISCILLLLFSLNSNISRIENGTCSPTIATLESLARGLNKRLVISFE